MLKQSLQQKLLQKLSPQQIQLMKLLQVPTLELEARIKQELEANPALEEGVEQGPEADDFDEREESSEAMEDFEQHLDVGKVQTCRRFIKQVERTPGALLDQFSSQLNALSLSSGKRRRGLPDLQIIKPYVLERLQLVANFWNAIEQLQRLLDIHLEYIGDRMPFEFDGKRFSIEAMTLANRTGYPHVREEIHFKFGGAISFASRTTSSVHIETETAWLVTSLFRFR